MCGAKHMMAGNPADCTRARIGKGSKYALVVGDKVCEGSADLRALAAARRRGGNNVRLAADASHKGGASPSPSPAESVTPQQELRLAKNPNYTSWATGKPAHLDNLISHPRVQKPGLAFAGYYERSRDVDEVIKLVGLEEKRDARVKTLSGGQKRRLDLGVALVGDPDLVFLDEPTTGFDPAARRAAWDMIRALRSLGKTILLTTHYLDEAEQLADRVAVLREGQIIREGTPAELTGGTNETEVRYRQDGHEVVIHTTEPTRLLQELTAAALAEGREVEGLQVRRPTLEDVYLSLTAPEER